MGQVRDIIRHFRTLAPAAEEAVRMVKRMEREARARKLAEETLGHKAEVGFPALVDCGPAGF